MWSAGYMGCSICGLLNGMWAVVEYVGSCMVCGLYDIRSARNMGCSKCGLFELYVGSCRVCELLYGIWAVEW